MMQCKSDGCYAKTFRRNLCRNHFYMWNDQLAPTTATASVREKGALRATPTPPSRTMTVECQCDEPRPERIPMFGCYQCSTCGSPLPTEGIIR